MLTKTNFKYLLCNNEWVVFPGGGYYKCWDEREKYIGNINDIPDLKSIVLCTRNRCQCALFTDKGTIGEYGNKS